MHQWSWWLRGILKLLWKHPSLKCLKAISASYFFHFFYHFVNMMQCKKKDRKLYDQLSALDNSLQHCSGNTMARDKILLMLLMLLLKANMFIKFLFDNTTFLPCDKFWSIIRNNKNLTICEVIIVSQALEINKSSSFPSRWKWNALELWWFYLQILQADARKRVHRLATDSA